MQSGSIIPSLAIKPLRQHFDYARLSILLTNVHVDTSKLICLVLVRHSIHSSSCDQIQKTQAWKEKKQLLPVSKMGCVWYCIPTWLRAPNRHHGASEAVQVLPPLHVLKQYLLAKMSTYRTHATRLLTQDDLNWIVGDFWDSDLSHEFKNIRAHLIKHLKGYVSKTNNEELDRA